MRGGRSVAIGALCMLSACGVFDADPLPPYGEALFVVDTDLPVPRVASRLRVDITTADGSPIATRDDVRPDPRDWPVSFSVYADDDSNDRVLLVRLRAYLDGRLTPAVGVVELEPDPLVTVDRVVRVTLQPGVRGRVPVVLRGACAGRPARLGDLASVASCTDGAEPLVPVVDSALEDSLATDVPSVVGSFGDLPCPEAPAGDPKVCVPGGAFVLGDAFYRPTGGSAGVETRPERIVRLTRFAIDRDEVTVARYRAAVARGFVAPFPIGVTERDGPQGGQPDACAFSAAPRGREGSALSCVAWVTAKAFCAFDGGALPTEAQWEYAALAAGRARKAVYPWGDDAPICGRGVWGRSIAYAECGTLSEGPVATDDATADVNALGIRNLAGGLEEQTVDSLASFDEPCWSAAPALDPSCTIAPPPECLNAPDSLECRVGPNWHLSTRGGSWYSGVDELRGTIRSETTAASRTSLLGFRCVYPAP